MRNRGASRHPPSALTAAASHLLRRCVSSPPPPRLTAAAAAPPLGAFASNGVNSEGLQLAFGLSLVQDGLLPAAFMVGLLLSSPFFAEAAKRGASALKLIGVGCAAWTAAVAGCGLAPSFGALLLCRAAVGVGEASFVALAGPFIDDVAPAASKARWLAAFFLCIPVGFALGFIYGGLVASALGWRAVFLLQAAAMAPFAWWALRAPPAALRGAAAAQGARRARAPAAGARAALAEAAADLRVLAARPVYLYTAAGMTAYTASLGALAYWGPRAGAEVFAVAPATADLSFGAVTVVAGVAGTLAGGAALDAAGSSLRNAALISAAGLAVGGAAMAAAFAGAASFHGFLAGIGAAEFTLFMTAAPSNALVLWSVPPELRPLAVAASVIAMHVFGDVPSAPLLGLLQSHVHNWRRAMLPAAAALGLGAAAYAGAVAAARTATDFRAAAAVAADEDEADGEEGGLLAGAGAAEP